MISESEFEEVEAEVVPSNQLQVIIKETGLEESLANEFVINFEEHFKMAATWAKKAKKIVVTDANQTVIMQEARTARLFLREKRIEIEKFRVARKEYYLKGGRAIDKVANFLKDTIIPIEEHLDRQEHFVELRKEAEDKRILEEAYAKQEAERIAKEEADRVALVKAQEENNKLKKAAAEKELETVFQLEKIRKENEAKLAEANKKALEAQRELELKKQAEQKAEADKIRAEEALAKAGDNDLMLILRKQLMDIKIPQFKSIQNKKISKDIKGYINLAINQIKIQEEEI